MCSGVQRVSYLNTGKPALHTKSLDKKMAHRSKQSLDLWHPCVFVSCMSLSSSVHQPHNTFPGWALYLSAMEWRHHSSCTPCIDGTYVIVTITLTLHDASARSYQNAIDDSMPRQIELIRLIRTGFASQVQFLCTRIPRGWRNLFG